MSIRFAIEEDGVVVLRVTLDPETADRLLAVADECHAEPSVVAASIIHDVLIEDAIAHQFEPPAHANFN